MADNTSHSASQYQLPIGTTLPLASPQGQPEGNQLGPLGVSGLHLQGFPSLQSLQALQLVPVGSLHQQLAALSGVGQQVLQVQLPGGVAHTAQLLQQLSASQGASLLQSLQLSSSAALAARPLLGSGAGSKAASKPPPKLGVPSPKAAHLKSPSAAAKLTSLPATSAAPQMAASPTAPAAAGAAPPAAQKQASAPIDLTTSTAITSPAAAPSTAAADAAGAAAAGPATADDKAASTARPLQGAGSAAPVAGPRPQNHLQQQQQQQQQQAPPVASPAAAAPPAAAGSAAAVSVPLPQPPTAAMSEKRRARLDTRRTLGLKRKFADVSTQAEAAVVESKHLLGWRSSLHSSSSASVLTEHDRHLLDLQHRRRLADIAAKQCLQALKQIMTHKFAWVFNTPVDVEKFRDYLKVVETPMDLGTIKQRLEAYQYRDPAEVNADAQLCFENARKFNPPGSDVYYMSSVLQEQWHERWSKMVVPKLAEESRISASESQSLSMRKSEAQRVRESAQMEQQAIKMVANLEELQNQISLLKAQAALQCEPLTPGERGQLTEALKSLPKHQLESVMTLVMSRLAPEMDPATGKHTVEVDLSRASALELRQMQSFVCCCHHEAAAEAQAALEAQAQHQHAASSPSTAATDAAAAAAPSDAAPTGADSGQQQQQQQQAPDAAAAALRRRGVATREITGIVPGACGDKSLSERAHITWPGLPVGSGLAAQARAQIPQLEDPLAGAPSLNIPVIQSAGGSLKRRTESLGEPTCSDSSQQPQQRPRLQPPAGGADYQAPAPAAVALGSSVHPAPTPPPPPGPVNSAAPASSGIPQPIQPAVAHHAPADPATALGSAQSLPAAAAAASAVAAGTPAADGVEREANTFLEPADMEAGRPAAEQEPSSQPPPPPVAPHICSQGSGGGLPGQHTSELVETQAAASPQVPNGLGVDVAADQPMGIPAGLPNGTGGDGT